jgi:hypothetical protein
MSASLRAAQAEAEEEGRAPLVDRVRTPWRDLAGVRVWRGTLRPCALAVALEGSPHLLDQAFVRHARRFAIPCDDPPSPAVSSIFSKSSDDANLDPLLVMKVLKQPLA